MRLHLLTAHAAPVMRPGRSLCLLTGVFPQVLSILCLFTHCIDSRVGVSAEWLVGVRAHNMRGTDSDVGR